MRPVLILAVLALLAISSLAFSLLTGSYALNIDDVFAALSGTADTVTRQIIVDLRWPRTAAAFVTGALLALAGALMQVLLRNPLADPYVLGISGGAATGALLSMLLGLGGWWLQGSAFTGALLSILMVFGIAHGSGAWNLIGTANWQLAPLVDLPTLWGVQVLLILVGHLFSLWIADRTARRLYPDGATAFRSQLPMLVGMVVFSIFSLWLLKQPMEMRTSAM